MKYRRHELGETCVLRIKVHRHILDVVRCISKLSRIDYIPFSIAYNIITSCLLTSHIRRVIFYVR